MPITLDDKMKKLSPSRRKKVEARAAQLIAQEMSLRDLRKARSLTQERLAERLQVSQDRISRLERRTDLLISTLRRHVASMGGNLSLVAEFPDREPVILAGLGNMDAEPPSTGRRGSGRAGKKHRY
jgi:DNA-binding XRE family transcriptional regulator